MPMTKGAVALLDALGFKGIWQRCEPWTPDDVVAKLKDAAQRAKTEREADEAHGFTDLISLDVHFLSDTVVLAAEAGGPAGRYTEPDHLIFYLCEKVTQFTENMLDDTQGPPIAYRGAIAYGDFMIDRPFILGPAVDEAAEAERLADGAFVWLCPTALRALGDRTPPPSFAYPVPMKNGGTFTTLVVPPVSDLPPSVADAMRQLEKAFGMPNAGVHEQIKYQNTVQMVREAREARVLHEPSLRKLLVDAARLKQ